MTARLARCLLVIPIIVALPVAARAQEASIGGTVRDATGGVLPGVTVTAVHETTGNTFETVTDERGGFRVAVRTGTYRLMLELAGFATLTRTGLEVLVGQQIVVSFEMAPSGLQETLTVTAEAPLVDSASSQLGGNVDSRQLSELPVNGRNWLDLTSLTPGSRTNATAEAPVGGEARGTYQLNVDGQQVTNYVQYNRANPRYSRDAIAEFEFISTRFDATQGRSMGVQVNAVTKSGTNTPAGTFAGYFRNDRFNAADHVVGRRLEYSNQQISGTFGGPIRRDRMHFFVNYEYEREPQTSTWTTPYRQFNLDLVGTRWERKAGVRFDVQFSLQSRLSLRANNWAEHIPYSAGSATTTPASSVVADNKASQLHLDFTRVLGTRGLNQIKAGYAGSGWSNDSEVRNPLADVTGGFGSPNIQLRGLTIGTGTFAPQRPTQDDYSIRNDFSYSFQRAGRHDLKAGGEYIYHNMVYFFCNVCNGQLDARGGPIPANIESLFPDLFDVSTWNLAALSPITVRWRQGIGDFRLVTPRHVYGAWIQDNWGVTSRLTLNLGVRYDVQTNSFENSVGIPPFLPADRPNDTNNIAPRFGFAYGLTPATVVRGGVGKYFADVHNPHFTRAFSQQLSPETPNDGRPDFASNPWNGPRPTYDQVLANLCSTRNVPGCLRRELPFTIFGPNAVIPHSYQASIGLQRQLGSAASVEADYIFTGERNAAWNATGHNVNLSYNPATGANYPFADISRRPYPDWGRVDNWIQQGARSNYHALSTGFVRRMRNGWQASGTYLLSVTRDAVALPVSGLEPVTFALAPDFGGEYSLAAEDQRHRAVFNAIWQAGYGFQLSGLYFYGSGQRYATSYGTDLRDVGGGGQLRLRPNGSIVPRNDFVGEPIHRVDLRVQRTFPLGGNRSIAGIIEAFNLFDRANYGSYTTQEVSPAYGRPVRSTNVAYQARMLQLGFRVIF